MFLRAAICLLFSSAVLRADEMEGFFTRWTQAESRLGSVRVSFEQEVKNPALRTPVKTPGVLWRLKDDDFRWELGQPARTILVRQGEALQVWEADSDKWVALDPKDRRFRSWLPFMGGKGMSLEQLRREFDVSLGADKTSLVMVPKSGMAKKYLKSIELRFASETMNLKQISVTQADGGATTMRFAAPEHVAEK